ncbi:serine/threonine-protein kinase [Botrimarina hoheduenensis]|uniref:Serine/threonine-protein kinase PrkC n=1 Tax=Botrimarina hoheduenensis TaxID=2528000 RepID=A0A5C5WFW2_9BACT|nr:serine/threonine-protein kinase [Botrimarina hoheduenensis]TWT48652.1 Serine/threonine-protein kinase PrkC [Botrimarina hoheduenensis]
MSELDANNLIELVRRSELIEPKRLDPFLDKWASQPEAAQQAPQSIAKALIDADLLTQWQADKLLAGKHKGFKLGKYKLLGAIGKGGMSHVYLAEHELMKRRVAVKVLPRQRVKDKSYLSRFQLEARAAARLDDPNIVRVYDIDNEGDNHYIVMEYVNGRDLHQTVSQDGPLRFETAADYIAQVARGLEHAHKMGLVHRDIKPANCLVDPNETVKLLDMGLAKLTDDETSLTLANDENVLGTADYLAPEQALNSHEADSRADIYSLGCTLYYLLAGRPPFPEGTISERLLKHQVEEPESLLSIRPDTPLTLVTICTRMMAKRAADRPQTADAVAELLTDWLNDQGYTPTRSGAKPRDGVNTDSGLGSGVGSGILSRYTQGSSSHGMPAAGGIGSASGDTAKLYASSGIDTDEDIGLAPLDDDDDGPSRKKARQDSSSSGVLSDVGESKETPANTASKSSLSSATRRKRSIFEEEYAEQEDDPIAKRAASKIEDAYDPLHPPGYTNPYDKTPIGLWIGLGVFLLLAAFIAFNLLG